MTKEKADNLNAGENLTQPLRMSYEEFLTWADEDVHAEWVDGEVIIMSPASEQHQSLVGFLTSILRFFVEAHQLGKIYLAPFQMKIGNDLPGREPDILFVASEHTDRIKTDHLKGAADLAIEIISPESRARDRGDKFYEYEQGGVREYWLIDPIRKQAEFYRLSETGIYQLVQLDEQGIFHSAVIPGLWLKADWLWQEPLPLLMSVLKEWKIL